MGKKIRQPTYQSEALQQRHIVSESKRAEKAKTALSIKLDEAAGLFLDRFADPVKEDGALAPEDHPFFKKPTGIKGKAYESFQRTGSLIDVVEALAPLYKLFKAKETWERQLKVQNEVYKWLVAGERAVVTTIRGKDGEITGFLVAKDESAFLRGDNTTIGPLVPDLYGDPPDTFSVERESGDSATRRICTADNLTGNHVPERSDEEYKLLNDRILTSLHSKISTGEPVLVLGKP